MSEPISRERITAAAADGPGALASIIAAEVGSACSALNMEPEPREPNPDAGEDHGWLSEVDFYANHALAHAHAAFSANCELGKLAGRYADALIRAAVALDELSDYAADCASSADERPACLYQARQVSAAIFALPGLHYGDPDPEGEAARRQQAKAIAAAADALNRLAGVASTAANRSDLDDDAEEYARFREDEACARKALALLNALPGGDSPEPGEDEAPAFKVCEMCPSCGALVNGPADMLADQAAALAGSQAADAARWRKLMAVFPWNTDEEINGGDVVDYINGFHGLANESA